MSPKSQLYNVTTEFVDVDAVPVNVTVAPAHCGALVEKLPFTNPTSIIVILVSAHGVLRLIIRVTV